MTTMTTIHLYRHRDTGTPYLHREGDTDFWPHNDDIDVDQTFADDAEGWAGDAWTPGIDTPVEAVAEVPEELEYLAVWTLRGGVCLPLDLDPDSIDEHLREYIGLPPAKEPEWHGPDEVHTILGGAVIRWYRITSADGGVDPENSRVRSILDHNSRRAARRVRIDGTTQWLEGDPDGLVVLGTHAGDRPSMQDALGLVPEYRELLDSLAAGSGIPLDGEAKHYTADQVAMALGVTPATVHSYSARGLLRPDQYTSRTPQWAPLTVLAYLQGRPGRGARTDLR